MYLPYRHALASERLPPPIHCCLISSSHVSYTPHSTITISIRQQQISISISIPPPLTTPPAFSHVLKPLSSSKLHSIARTYPHLYALNPTSLGYRTVTYIFTIKLVLSRPSPGTLSFGPSSSHARASGAKTASPPFRCTCHVCSHSRSRSLVQYHHGFDARHFTLRSSDERVRYSMVRALHTYILCIHHTILRE
ncbi:hypothetical protein PYCCODRAFT_13768 [Trametes coccinea BRFM310]|uniref:Uncharacterized protein n=1 Tax=Trametes coccinea (strain BRFM310) TaxID=1353009 RepID=A0A1Y2J4M5_TRAC3|nr:hypothetical protein PYCCODRAFT_13768 [Trametes coccinea BRFM310]